MHPLYNKPSHFWRLKIRNVVVPFIFFTLFLYGVLIWTRTSDSTIVLNQSSNIDLHFDSSFRINNSIKPSSSSEPGDDSCDRVLLYASDYLNPVGLVAQLNTFLRAMLIAIVEDRRLVFLHSDEESMFGCPGIHEDDSSSGGGRLLSYPGGMSHVLDVSRLSRNCPPPPCHRLQKWHRLAYRVMQKKNMDHHITCRNGDDAEDSSTTSVLLLGGHALRHYFREEIQPKLDAADNIENWGKRLGIDNYAEIQSLRHDANKNVTQRSYQNRIMQLVKQFVQFQPWIMKDVKKMMQNHTGHVPFDEMIGVHVRRGDKLKVESRYWVEDYWRRQGFSKEHMPVNYVPLIAYLQKIPSSFEPSIRDIYIATDDPATIQQEIKELPADRYSQWRFHFNPLATSGHLNALEDCRDKYQHTIAAIFDLTVLESTKLFVGEYNSNWGRWVRYRREGEVQVVFGPSDVSWPR